MARKTIFVIMVMAILLCNVVVAGELFNKWIISGSTFEFNGQDCSVKYYGQIGKVSLKIGDDRFQVAVGDCEEKGTISYCFDMVDQNKGEYVDGKAYPGVKLVFKTSEPNIKITRDFSTKSPQVNEKVEVEVTVKNTGDVRATNLVLTESFVNGISLYTTTAIPYGLGWKYETFLDPGQERTFKYTFKPTLILDYESIVHSSYSFPAGTGTEDSDIVVVSVETPIEMSHNLSIDSVKINELTTYNMIIENTDIKDADVDIEITFPSGVDIVTQDREFAKTGKILSYSGEIRGGKKKTLSVELRGNKDGEYDIKVHGDFSSPAITFSKDLVKKIIVSVSDIIPFLEISPHDVISDDFYKMTAKLTNKLDTTISGIDLTISGPVIKKLSYVNEKLLEGETLTLVDTQYLAPDIAAPINLTVTLAGNYRDAKTNEVYHFETTDYLNIKPAENVMEIITEAPKGVSKGKDFEFKVFVKNLKSSLIPDVSAATSIPKGVQIKGSPYGDINLGNLEKKEAFSMTLNVPETFDGNVLVIETIANAEYKKKFVKETQTTRISLDGEVFEPVEKEKKVVEEVEEIKEDNASINASVKVEKEKGFFGRIWAWIKGIF